jgi:NAD(P)-dependent dehydrogenase (short-subunit alcohol dehydrogenase family)
MTMPTTLITGANKGIGLKLAERYAAAGHKVIACCRNPDGASDLKALAGDVQVEGVVVGDDASVADLKGRLGDQPIDLLINNAGMAGPAPDQQSAAQMDYAGWMETFNVNTMGPLRMVQAFRPNMAVAGSAKAVTITSQMGALSLDMPVMYAYCSSKAAVNKVMRMYAADAKRDGIAVQLIHPGWVQTDMGGAQAEITPDQSADGIVSVIDGLSMDSTASFMKWDGEPHAW